MLGRIWDRRRLVLPCSDFVERPIQNWTRYSSDIVGTVMLHVDDTTPVDAVRAELEPPAPGGPDPGARGPGTGPVP